MFLDQLEAVRRVEPFHHPMIAERIVLKTGLRISGVFEGEIVTGHFEVGALLDEWADVLRRDLLEGFVPAHLADVIDGRAGNAAPVKPFLDVRPVLVEVLHVDAQVVLCPLDPEVIRVKIGLLAVAVGVHLLGCRVLPDQAVESEDEDGAPRPQHVQIEKDDGEGVDPRLQSQPREHRVPQVIEEDDLVHVLDEEALLLFELVGDVVERVQMDEQRTGVFIQNPGEVRPVVHVGWDRDMEPEPDLLADPAGEVLGDADVVEGGVGGVMMPQQISALFENGP